MQKLLSRASFLRLSATSLLIPPSTAFADENEISKEDILHEPEAPTAGNPDGDLTIVDFFDYNCPFCKRRLRTLSASSRPMERSGSSIKTGRSWSRPPSSVRE